MTSLSIDSIFSNFLGYIGDNRLAALDEGEAYDQMMEWLRKAYNRPYVRRLFNEFELDTDAGEINIRMAFETTFDAEFATDVLALGMVIEWLKPQVRDRVNIAQFFGGKEQKWFSQSNHLSELRAMLEDVTLEQRKIIRDRGYIYNPYLEDEE